MACTVVTSRPGTLTLSRRGSGGFWASSAPAEVTLRANWGPPAATGRQALLTAEDVNALRTALGSCEDSDAELLADQLTDALPDARTARELRRACPNGILVHLDADAHRECLIALGEAIDRWPNDTGRFLRTRDTLA